MFQHILVPLDGSKNAEKSIPVASRLARASGGSIVFVRAVLPPVEFGKYAKQHSIAWERAAYETQHAQAASYLVGTTLKYGNELAGIDVGLVVATGITPSAICSAARLEHADLIVMHSHDESAIQRWFFGSVTQEVSRHSSVPVLILHEHGPAIPARRASLPLRVMVPLNGSAASEVAFAPAIEFLEAFAGQEMGILHLLRVIDMPPIEGKMRSQAHIDTSLRTYAKQEAEAYLARVAERLYKEHAEASWLSITTSVIISTDIAGTIAQQAEYNEEVEHAGGSDLIVVAKHEHRGLERLLRGHVTKHMLRSTRLPLLVVHPQEVTSGRP
ncbi:MAG TPA: universal stress protein [Ktedonobacteraceae bacterium]|nr:universal stress protein [Ktedonobacteraceae bacterium]